MDITLKPKDYPTEGLCCDASYLRSKDIAEYQAHNLKTGEQIAYCNLGENRTVNIAEYLALIECIKYIIETGITPRIIYSDSLSAITWVKNRTFGSDKKDKDGFKAALFTQVFSFEIDSIDIRKWDTQKWGEIPSDFGRK